MIVSENVIELGSDEGVFTVSGADMEDLSGPVVPSNTLVEFPGGGEWDAIWVLTGSQWGPFRVVARVLSADPGAPAAEWEDVVELSVETASGLAVCELVDGPYGDLSTEAGRFRLRVSASGRSESAARDDRVPFEGEDEEEPLEHYLLELWPDAPRSAEVLRESSAHAMAELHPPVAAPTSVELAGEAAARRVLVDVRRVPGLRRQLGGARGTVRVSYDAHGSLPRVWEAYRSAMGWPPCNGGSGGPDSGVGSRSSADATEPGGRERYGTLDSTVLHLEARQVLTRSWNWRVPGLDGYVRPESPMFFLDDHVVTVRFTDTGAGLVRVDLVHEGLPEVWVEDFTTLWTWDLVRRQRLL